MLLWLLRYLELLLWLLGLNLLLLDSSLFDRLDSPCNLPHIAILSSQPARSSALKASLILSPPPLKK